MNTIVTTADDQTQVDQAIFRNVAGHFASGVAVVTTAVDGVPYGTTVSAVSSLSMDPPMMLVCLNRSSNTHDQVKKSHTFAISVLSSDQADLAYRFAGKGDKFDGVETDTVHGMPVLRGALAHIVCTTAEEAVGGTHTVFLGNVIVAGTSNAQPLAYYRGAFGSFHSDREEQAYLTVRRWVLEHRELKNQIIPLAELVESVGLPKDQVGRAVAKLTVDRLLGIDLNDQITVLPITSKLMTDCIEGRAAIECGVLTTHLDTLSDQDAAEIRTIFEQMQQLRGTPGEMRTFLDLNNTLQNRIMNLGSSNELTRAFNRMGIGAVWAQTVPHDSWDQFFDSRSQQKLVDALEQRDAVAACEAVMEHARVTTRLAQELIEKNGGEV